MLSGLFEKLKSGLTKTRQSFTEKVSAILHLHLTINDDLYDELEELLVTADIGIDTSMEIIDRLKKSIMDNKIKDPALVNACLKGVLLQILEKEEKTDLFNKERNILLIIGVNGVGKTTSIGKLAAKLKGEGKKILLAAGDTFRAGAIEQLEIWSHRAKVDIVMHQEGSDPAAVVYDAIQASKARGVDVLICDTAGRLHNKKNLMEELAKINRVINREYNEANKKTLLVLDATTGQNAIAQAIKFKEICPIDGIILTKLDGTAKGGVVIAIQNALNIPVKYIAVGESIEDLQEFDAKAFVDALF